MGVPPLGLDDLALVLDAERASALLHPLRLRLLALAREPASASEMAARLGLPRQRVGYHVRLLARAGFLRRAGRRRKRNMVEQRYRAAARAFVLAPEILGPLEADWRQVEDAGSAAYLLALTEQVRSDLARAWQRSGKRGKDLAAISVKSQFRFGSPEERERFARDLREAVVRVIAERTSPNLRPNGSPAPGEPWRLVLGCYPVAFRARFQDS